MQIKSSLCVSCEFFLSQLSIVAGLFFGHLLDSYCHFCYSAWFGSFLVANKYGLSAFSAIFPMGIGNTVVCTHKDTQIHRYTLALALFVCSFVLFFCCCCFFYLFRLVFILSTLLLHFRAELDQ